MKEQNVKNVKRMYNKKQTTANNPFLKNVKRMYNKHVFKYVSEIVNEEGLDAGKKALKNITDSYK